MTNAHKATFACPVWLQRERVHKPILKITFSPCMRAIHQLACKDCTKRPAGYVFDLLIQPHRRRGWGIGYTRPFPRVNSVLGPSTSLLTVIMTNAQRVYHPFADSSGCTGRERKNIQASFHFKSDFSSGYANQLADSYRDTCPTGISPICWLMWLHRQGGAKEMQD